MLFHLFRIRWVAKMWYNTVWTGSFIFNIQNVHSDWFIATYSTLKANTPVFWTPTRELARHRYFLIASRFTIIGLCSHLFHLALKSPTESLQSDNRTLLKHHLHQRAPYGLPFPPSYFVLSSPSLWKKTSLRAT